MTEPFMRTFSSSFSSAQTSKLSSHSAGWWPGNLLSLGRSIPMSMEMLPPFSLLICHSPVTPSQNLSSFEVRTTSLVKQYDTEDFQLDLTKCGSALLFTGKHQVGQEETHVSALACQESLFLLQDPPLPHFAQQTAGHLEERIRMQWEQTTPWLARKGIHSHRHRGVLYFFFKYI